MSVEVLLTVGKLDASLALLTTKDHHVIEFPTTLLPERVRAGSVVKMVVEQSEEEENRKRAEFARVQEEIVARYGSSKPEPPVLRSVNVTQTGCVLAWDSLQLGSARLKSLALFRQGIRSAVVPNPRKVTSTKVSGLAVDTKYEFQLRLTTTAGTYWSETLVVHTRKMTDLAGITACLGPLDPLQQVRREQIEKSLKNIGARAPQDRVSIDTTHFICNDRDAEDEPELLKAKNSNIPIVRPEWVRACELEKRMVGVRGFYLDSDPAIQDSYAYPQDHDESSSTRNASVVEVRSVRTDRTENGQLGSSGEDGVNGIEGHEIQQESVAEEEDNSLKAEEDMKAGISANADKKQIGGRDSERDQHQDDQKSDEVNQETVLPEQDKNEPDAVEQEEAVVQHNDSINDVDKEPAAEMEQHAENSITQSLEASSSGQTPDVEENTIENPAMETALDTDVPSVIDTTANSKLEPSTSQRSDGELKDQQIPALNTSTETVEVSATAANESATNDVLVETNAAPDESGDAELENTTDEEPQDSQPDVTANVDDKSANEDLSNNGPAKISTSNRPKSKKKKNKKRK